MEFISFIYKLYKPIYVEGLAFDYVLYNYTQSRPTYALLFYIVIIFLLPTSILSLLLMALLLSNLALKIKISEIVILLKS